MNLSDEDVRDILALLDSTAMTELHLSTAEFSLSLRRSGDGWTRSSTVLAAPAAGGDVVRPAEPAAGEPATDEPAAPSRTGVREVRAPLPGTFYRAPKPGAAPFVEIGDRVTETTVIGIVETMKLMNSVLAGVAGTVLEFPIGNGEFAAQDAVLLLVDPETS